MNQLRKSKHRNEYLSHQQSSELPQQIAMYLYCVAQHHGAIGQHLTRTGDFSRSTVKPVG